MIVHEITGPVLLEERDFIIYINPYITVLRNEEEKMLGSQLSKVNCVSKQEKSCVSVYIFTRCVETEGSAVMLCCERGKWNGLVRHIPNM